MGDSRRVISTIRTEENEDKVLSTTWQSVDGLRSRQEMLGVAAHGTTVRTRPVNGTSSTIVTAPDLTLVETIALILPNGNQQTTSVTKAANGAAMETNVTLSDALGRELQTTNGRGHVKTISYHGAGGMIASAVEVNAAPGGGDLETHYSYSTLPGAGSLVTTTLPDGTFQYQENNLLGQTTRQWGSQVNPLSYTYDLAGRMVSHTTYRSPVGANAHSFPSIPGDSTQWVYDPSGVLLEKVHADGSKITYTYDTASRVITRKRHGGGVTLYGYTAGDLTSLEYFGSAAALQDYLDKFATWQMMASDPAAHTEQEIAAAKLEMETARAAGLDEATPSVNNSYNRIGQLMATGQAAGPGISVSSNTYTYNPQHLGLEVETITIDPDGANGGMPALTRNITRTRDNLHRPTGFLLGNEHAVGYGYEVSGRLATISAQGLPNLPGKPQAFEYIYEPGYSLPDKVTGPVHEVDNDYETHRNVLSQKKNTRTIGTPGDVSIVGYGVNGLEQVTQRSLRGELRAGFYGGASADAYSTDWTYDALGQVGSEQKPTASENRSYSFDSIGNRLSSTTGGIYRTYVSNSLNQYEQIVPPAPDSPIPTVYDADGNLTDGPLAGSPAGKFTYDQRNQLVAARVTANSELFRYTYDTFGRRTAKLVYPAQGGNAPGVTLFIHDGWNLVAEYKLNQGNWEISRSYTWGIDIDGQLQGAGGVGGLLAVTKHQTQSTSHFYPIYDGNGNIEAYLDSNGVPAAIYQYDAFGNILQGAGAGAGPAQMEFSHTFSTKFTDFETGLLYYGSRYYHPELGKWLNRDTIGEDGGANLYGFLGNSAVNYYDFLGFSPQRRPLVWPGSKPGMGGPMVEVGEQNNAVNPIEAIRALMGILGSTITGDYFDDPAPPMEYVPGGCEYLITVNGIFNTEVEARLILETAKKLPFYKNIDGSSWASNGTHFDVNLKKPGGGKHNRVSLGDFGQILLNETVKAIDISALRLADRINAAIKAMKAAGCECYCLHILAHSQGAMLADMALALVPEKDKENIDVITVGAQKAMPEYEALHSVYNLVHVDDGVPNSWGSAPFSNGGRGVNPFRWLWNRPGKVHYFGKRGTFEDPYAAHDFSIYAEELARNPPKVRSCPKKSEKKK